MPGEVELLQTRELDRVIGHDANGLVGAQDTVNFEQAVIASQNKAVPAGNDVLPLIQYSDETLKDISYDQLVAAIRGSLFGWPDLTVGNRVFLDQVATPANSPGNAGTGYTRCYPFRIWRPITISELGARVGTGGGNSRFGIYQHNASVRRPGLLVAATGSVATSSGGVASGALVDASGNPLVSATLLPGVYWAALRVDNTTVQFAGMGANTIFGSLIGDASSDLLGSSSTGNRALDYNYTGVGFAENFAADLSAVTPNTSAFANANAHLLGRVA